MTYLKSLLGIELSAIAVGFNVFFGWRRYPAFLSHHKTSPPAGTPSHEEILRALRCIDSFVDVTEDDLIQLRQILAPGHELGECNNTPALP